MSEVRTKRGRPPTIMAGFEKSWPDITTRRGLLNKYYETNGHAVVKAMQDEGIARLDFIRNPVTQRCKWGILRELGRFDKDTAEGYAIAICDLQRNSSKTVKEWERTLRLLRLHPDLVKEAISETVSENGSDNGVKGNDI